MESLSDIVAIMRRGTKLPGYWMSCDLNKILAYHADRIEAAWKREKAAIEADALAVGGIVEASRHKPGNAAAMREALEAYLALWNNGTMNDLDKLRRVVGNMRAALSAPARQCDVGTPDELDRRRSAYCRDHSCRICPLRDSENGGVSCDITWSQMPYAEKGAGNDK